MQRKTLLVWSVICVLGVAGCSEAPQTMLSPSAVEPFVTFVNADGSAVKVGAPGDLGPNGGVLETRRPTLSFTSAAGRFQQAGFSYELQLQDAAGASVYERMLGESVGLASHTIDVDLPYSESFWWRVRARFGSQFGPWSAFAAFRTPAPPPPPPPPPTGGGGRGPLPRTPDPAPGTRLPLLNMLHIVQQVVTQYPREFFNSCQERGGSWAYMDLLVDTLRTIDNRWGYNWKRGIVGDPSLDIVDYHFGAGLSEGATQVYIIDTMLGHCSSSPSPTWSDVTPAMIAGGGVGRWTGRGRFTN